MFLYIDGVDKAGKDTLIDLLVKKLQESDSPIGVKIVRSWGVLKSSVNCDQVYGQFLNQYVKDGSLSDPNQLVIFNRGWVSNHIYAKVTPDWHNQYRRRLRSDPWLGEWLYGRALQSCGMGVIMTGSNGEDNDVEILGGRWTKNDPPKHIIPDLIQAFRDYANEYMPNYILIDKYSLEDLEKQAEIIRLQLLNCNEQLLKFKDFPNRTGNPYNTDMVVRSDKSRNGSVPGGFLPWSSPREIQYARGWGAKAFNNTTWGIATRFDPSIYAHVKRWFSTDLSVRKWLQQQGVPNDKIIDIEPFTQVSKIPPEQWTEMVKIKLDTEIKQSTQQELPMQDNNPEKSHAEISFEELFPSDNGDPVTVPPTPQLEQPKNDLPSEDKPNFEHPPERENPKPQPETPQPNQNTVAPVVSKEVAIPSVSSRLMQSMPNFTFQDSPFEAEDVEMARVFMVQPRSSQSDKYKVGHYVIVGRESQESITVVPVGWSKVRNKYNPTQRARGVFELECHSSDSKTGVGDPGGTCEVCPMKNFGFDSNGDTIAPRCSVGYEYILWIEQFQTLAITRMDRTQVAVARKLNTFIQLYGLTNFAVTLTGEIVTKSQSGFTGYYVPRLLLSEDYPQAKLQQIKSLVRGSSNG